MIVTIYIKITITDSSINTLFALSFKFSFSFLFALLCLFPSFSCFLLISLVFLSISVQRKRRKNYKNCEIFTLIAFIAWRKPKGIYTTKDLRLINQHQQNTCNRSSFFKRRSKAARHMKFQQMVGGILSQLMLQGPGNVQTFRSVLKVTKAIA